VEQLGQNKTLSKFIKSIQNKLKQYQITVNEELNSEKYLVEEMDICKVQTELDTQKRLLTKH
jgi:hypothetical protein